MRGWNAGIARAALLLGPFRTISGNPRWRWASLILALALGSEAGLLSSPWPRPQDDAPGLIGTSAARAVEIGGATFFAKAPWKVDLISYSTIVGQPQPEYFLTLELDPDAGASLGSFRFQQIRGADWQFPFSPERTYAFLGRPRQQRRRVPVQARWDAGSRTMLVTFPEPVAPGSTVTTVLIPWFNPMQSDTYLFEVEVFPAGPNPVGSPAGVGTLRIYPCFSW